MMAAAALPVPAAGPAQPRVIVLCCDGVFQRHLVERVREEFSLVGIVVQETVGAKGTLGSRLGRYLDVGTLARYLWARIELPMHERRARELIRTLGIRIGQASVFPPEVPLLRVSDVNSPAATGFLRGSAADIVLVNGTNLLRRPMLSAAAHCRFGVVNLHTGLSPYSRGGNCNLFMLLEGCPDLVGVTVHHIDQGIDSGDLILTSQVRMDPRDNYEMVDVRTFHQGIELLIDAVRLLIEGKAPRVSQWEKGKLFLKRTGYVYEPFQRLRANRLLGRGMVRDYLARKGGLGRKVRLVGPVDA